MESTVFQPHDEMRADSGTLTLWEPG